MAITVTARMVIMGIALMAIVLIIMATSHIDTINMAPEITVGEAATKAAAAAEDSAAGALAA